MPPSRPPTARFTVADRPKAGYLFDILRSAVWQDANWHSNKFPVLHQTECGDGGSTLLLFLNRPMTTGCSGQIPETVVL